MPIIEFAQRLPAPLEEVFAFYADPYNLLKITPAGLNLVITNKEPVEMAKGAEITYQIKWMRLPLNWRTIITEYDPPHTFTDVQVSGPYRKWEHTHIFKSLGDETLVTDHLVYELPFGFLGRAVAGRLVGAQVNQIFAYRNQKLAEYFPIR